MQVYPQIEQVKLVDYKVRILDSQAATGAKTRVLIESTDGTRYWTTVGSSTDIIEASAKAYLNAINKLLLVKEQQRRKAKTGA